MSLCESAVFPRPPVVAFVVVVGSHRVPLTLTCIVYKCVCESSVFYPFFWAFVAVAGSHGLLKKTNLQYLEMHVCAIAIFFIFFLGGRFVSSSSERYWQFLDVCVCECIRVYNYVCVYTCIYVYVSVCIYFYIYTHIYMYVYIYIYIYIHIYVHTYIHMYKYI